MVSKIKILGMLIVLHSLGLVIVSLFTYKWYVDDTREFGIFGICNTSFKEILNADNSNKTKIELINETQRSPTNKMLRLLKKRISVIETKVETDQRTAIDLFSSEKRKCYQLLLPDTNEAFFYLSGNTVYLTALMGVAISSATMGLLTLLWSIICIISKSIGEHPRGSEFLILLSVLSDLATITTYGMFMFKDTQVILFSFYGFSFWLSVGASVGFFLSTILFAIDRVNIGFNDQLSNYQGKYQVS